MAGLKQTRRGFLKQTGAGFLLAGAGVTGVGLFSRPAFAQSALEQARKDGTIRVGFANEAPYAFASPEGQLVGLMPDVIKHIMNKLGVPSIEGVLTDFGGLIPGLLAGRFDTLGAGLYITKVRCEQALPSDPHYVVSEAIAVKAGNPRGLGGYDDVARNEEVKIGTLAGSVNVQYLATAGVPTERIVLFPDLPSAIAGLQGGRVDGVTMSAVSLQDILKKTNDPGLEIATPFRDPVDEAGNPVRGFGAAWFRPGEEDLVAAYNQVLAEIKANGTLLQLMQPYGFAEAQVPPAEVTAAQLCGA